MTKIPSRKEKKTYISHLPRGNVFQEPVLRIMRLIAITSSGFLFKMFQFLERIYANQEVKFLFFLSPGPHPYKSLGNTSKCFLLSRSKLQYMLYSWKVIPIYPDNLH